MNKIIEKTFELIDELDNSLLIKELFLYKNKAYSNDLVKKLINNYNNSLDEEKYLIKKELYKNIDYNNYIKRYNELSLLIFKINNKYKAILNNKVCKNSE